ncbi:type IV pilus modification protein PilV [Pseudomonas sp. Gutcm_11s]|uniref:type IV pilus modification protein PilV n=1 Tax=Pseudomonas sp. Gutcm_11s TaxID=3026088 RepID=UPI00235ED06F|nr:type IV pilus modification protein PilV [Pseudomonas sp. Gutcm_11s]MDD0844523.1 type IV pilus modification protein PilV [Pseudomonas sp. Gutcm_11s]
MKTTNSRPNGFTLIEVLVTLVLLTIGMLGLVAMQGRGIQYTSDSAQRNNAVMLANELLEQIRANPSALSDFSMKKLPEIGTCDTSTAIQVNDVEKQLTCWANKVRLILPEAEALKDEFYVCRSATPGSCAAGSAIEIQLAWRAAGGNCLDDSAEANADTSICHFRLRGEL